MTKDKALKLVQDALEALENISTALREEDVLGSDIELMLNTISKIHTALAQPEQDAAAFIAAEDRKVASRYGYVPKLHPSEWQVAQPELCKYGQEPKSCTSSPMDCQCAIEAALALPEQKPFTYYNPVRDAIRPFPVDGDIALYTTTPQRPWVGLTDDEIDLLEELYAPPVHPDFVNDADHCLELIRHIEAKLKEKNT